MKMPSEEEIYDLSDFFKIFGDSTRIKILSVLRQGESGVQSLADKVEMSQSAVSHQLNTLRLANLVKKRREGKTIFYSLADDHIATILDMGLEHINE
ncbi:MAG: metalloregulator ArsR/SmtB family transcription factor [Lachnospiraceae bacterium]|nr:metalloregulator ArsR/SmtB family transcription factor [Lachnospiraceae bacterium]